MKDEIKDLYDDDSPISGLSDERKKELKSLAHKDKSEIDDAEITSYVQDALKRKYDYGEYVLLFEVTGKKGRRIDALAYGLYQSRNYKTIGFEIKASRSDWKKELESHSKNDWFVGQVDEFYVVAGRKGIVKESELPEGWGLLEMKGGGKLYKVVESDLTYHQDREIDREFYVKGIKKAFSKLAQQRRELKWDLNRAYNRGMEAGKKKGDLSDRQEELIRKGEKFEELQDFDIGMDHLYSLDEDRMKNLEDAYNLIKLLDEDAFGRSSITSNLSKMKKAHDRIEDGIKQIEQEFNDIEEKVREG